MILGKTYKQIDDKRQKYLKKWYNKRQKVFIWIPVVLNQGDIVWLQYAWKDLGIYHDNNNDKLYYYIGSSFIYYINETGNV